MSMDDLAAQGGVEGVAAAELRQFIERIERLEEEKTTLHINFHTFPAVS